MTTLLRDRRFVTDGGLEKDLSYHHGADLRVFALFPLVEQTRGRERLLVALLRRYADVAAGPVPG